MIEGERDIVVKAARRDARGSATRCPPRSTPTRSTSSRELDALFRAMWICAGRARKSRGRVSSCSARSPATASSSRARHDGTRARVPQRLPASRHAPLHGSDRPVPRQHSVPVPRVDLRARRTAGGRAAHGRGAAFPEGGLPLHRGARRRVGRAHLPEPGAEPAAASRSTRRPAGEVRAWRMQDLRLGHRIVYDVKANWKLDHPELQRVPALPQPASGAQQAVALPER